MIFQSGGRRIHYETLKNNQIMFHYYFDFTGNEESSRTIAFFDLFWWIKLKEDDDVSPLTSARRTYEKFFASAQDDGGQIPSNQFGRGQSVSSVSTGWTPKPTTESCKSFF